MCHFVVFLYLLQIFTTFHSFWSNQKIIYYKKKTKTFEITQFVHFVFICIVDYLAKNKIIDRETETELTKLEKRSNKKREVKNIGKKQKNTHFARKSISQSPWIPKSLIHMMIKCFDWLICYISIVALFWTKSSNCCRIWLYSMHLLDRIVYTSLFRWYFFFFFFLIVHRLNFMQITQIFAD